MKYKILSVILIIFATCCLYMYLKNHYKNVPIDYTEEYKKVTDSLNLQINYMDNIIKQQNDKIIDYEEKIRNAGKIFVKNNTKIKEIHDTYEIQIHAIDSYNVTQLQDFLTGRYTDSNITKPRLN